MNMYEHQEDIAKLQLFSHIKIPELMGVSDTTP